MNFKLPSEDTVAKSERALRRVELDAQQRELDRQRLVRETGYMMLGPGFF